MSYRRNSGSGGIVGLAIVLIIFVDFIGVFVAVALIALLIVLIVRADRRKHALPPEEYRNALTPGLYAVWSCPYRKPGDWTLQGEYPADVIKNVYQLDVTALPNDRFVRVGGFFYSIGRDPRARPA